MSVTRIKMGLSRAEAPPWSVYPFVLQRYRSGGSYLDNLMSLFMWHTETLNAWIMIAASTMSLLGTTYVCTNTQSSSCKSLMLLTASALVHLPFSVGYHLFISMDRQVSNLWRRLDTCAIFWSSVLLAASLGSVVFPHWLQVVHVGGTAMIAWNASLQFWKTPDDIDQLDERSHVKLILSVVACYLGPMLIGATQNMLMSMYTLGTIASLGLGSWMFATMWPQRRWPGRFDLIGHSHQLMHVCVLFAHLFEFLFVYQSSTNI